MSEFAGFVFDIDKTAVPNGAESVDCEVLLDAFESLPDDVIAIAATGRAPDTAMPIIQALDLRHDSVIANGALIVDSQTGEPWWERLLSEGQVSDILEVCKPYPFRFWMVGDPVEERRAPAEQTVRSTAAAYMTRLPGEIAHDVFERIVEIPGVNAYLSTSWSGKEGEIDINIGHAEAHKRTALEVLFGKYAVDASEMIGVGDGINDIELFQAVGHSIAVGDAHPKLIEMADEVVAAHDEQGLVEVIHRFIV
jgi:HAD superfamily hydrolase (TIGR01484 family)